MFALAFALISEDLRAQSVRLVDVSGRRLEVSVKGTGTPVVVLEAGLGQDRRDWVHIQDSVATFTTVVAYSRAGYGNSDPSDLERTPLRVMSELRDLLRAMRLPGPYVLVGQSLGAIYARVFARQYPNEVAGLVLVDPSHERGFQLCSELSGSPQFWDDLWSRFSAAADSVGGGMPGELDELWRIWRRGTLPEGEPLPDVPMVVLTAYQPDPSWICTSEPSVRNLRRLHAQHFAQTTNGAHIVTSKSGHLMHVDQPGLVVESIRRIVEAVR